MEDATHRGLIPRAKDDCADFEVALGTRHGVIRVGKQQPFVEQGVAVFIVHKAHVALQTTCVWSDWGRPHHTM